MYLLLQLYIFSTHNNVITFFLGLPYKPFGMTDVVSEEGNNTKKATNWWPMWELTGSNRRPSACKADFFTFHLNSLVFICFLFLSKTLSVLSFIKFIFSFIFFRILFFTNFVCKLYANLKYESNNNYRNRYSQAIEKWKVSY